MNLSNNKIQRLEILDVARGILCIFVVWQHLLFVNLKNYPHPIWFKWFFWIIGQQGAVAVFFFFVLAGFLMTWLYPEIRDVKSYYLKRLSRILPLFWVACITYTTYEMYHPNVFVLFLVTMSGLLLIKYLWMFFLKNTERQKLFLILIICIFLFSAIWYLMILRSPAIALQSWPKFLYTILVFLVNSTLTLSLGNYIPTVNLVFWSMGLELLFYFFYPLINLVFIKPLYHLQRADIDRLTVLNKKLSLGLMIAGVIIYLLIYFISLRAFSLYFFHFETSIYFLIGIIWGMIYVHTSEKKSFVSPVFFNQFFYSKFTHTIVILYAFFVILVNAHVSVFGSSFINDFHRTIIAVPFVGISFGYLLYYKRRPNIIFSKTYLLKLLGKISYSLYLFHAIVLIYLGTIEDTDSSFVVLRKFFSQTFISISIATFFYWALEKDYFRIYRDLIQTNKNNLIKYSSKKAVVLFFVIIQILIIVAYRPSFSENITPLKQRIDRPLKISESPLQLEFVSNEDGLGIIMIRLRNSTKLVVDSSKQTKSNSEIFFSLKDLTTDEEIGITKIPINGFGVLGDPYPVGFPEVINSNNHHYLLTISLPKSHPGEQIELLPTNELGLVYSYNKIALLRNPSKMISILKQKLKLFLFQRNLFIFTTVNLFLGIYFYKIHKKFPKNFG